jgi:hypothetical protein
MLRTKATLIYRRTKTKRCLGIDGDDGGSACDIIFNAARLWR